MTTRLRSWLWGATAVAVAAVTAAVGMSVPPAAALVVLVAGCTVVIALGRL